MKNNKGFAISLMLYAMILLIVTIFYIVLAIVKTRFTYSETMVNSAIEFLDKHDDSMNHKDRTGPLVVFDPPAAGFTNKARITIDIFDDNDGDGLDETSIIIGGKTSDTANMEIYYKDGYTSSNIKSRDINSNKTHAKFILETSNSITLYVSVKDRKGNYSQTLPRYTQRETAIEGIIYRTYSYQKYIVGDTGPSCTITGPKLVSYTSTGTPGTSDYKINISGYSNIQNNRINSGDVIAYELVCEGENGIDAYLNVNDFKHTSKTLSDDNKQNKYIYVNSISAVNGINKTRVVILATGLYIPESTNEVECTEPLAIELKEAFNIKDSSGNMAVIGNNQKLDFNNHKVRVCFDPNTNPSNSGGNNSGGNNSGGNNNGGSNPPSSTGMNITGAATCNKYFYGFTFSCGDSRPVFNARYGFTSERAAKDAGIASLNNMIASCSTVWDGSDVEVANDWGYTVTSDDGTVNTSQPHIATRNQAIDGCRLKLNGKSGTCRITCG